MKKPVIALMALACTLAVSSAAFAASPITSAGGSDSHDVVGKFDTEGTGSGSATKYSVDVEWGAMEFTYNANSGTWNPDNHTYEGGSWNSSSNTVKVTNHSNAAVNVAVTYSAEPGYADISGSFANGSFQLATAVGTTKGEAPNQTATLTLTGGDLASTQTDNVKLGTATVTITAVA